jgi:L-lysine exporter family protein LysE/ArgO
MDTLIGVAATGFALAATLIIAIGAQNAFVLRQGLRREHVGAVVALCALADLLLIAAGVAGLGQALQALPALERGLTAGGALFLLAYGLRALWRARDPGALQAAAAAGPASRRQVLLQAAGFTLLNPHVYLDTVLLMGVVGAQVPPPLRPVFVGGAALASALWFTGLGYGARRLAPWFARPRAWQLLDFGVGLTMLGLATALGLRLL